MRCVVLILNKRKILCTDNMQILCEIFDFPYFPWLDLISIRDNSTWRFGTYVFTLQCDLYEYSKRLLSDEWRKTFTLCARKAHWFGLPNFTILSSSQLFGSARSARTLLNESTHKYLKYWQWQKVWSVVTLWESEFYICDGLGCER